MPLLVVFYNKRWLIWSCCLAGKVLDLESMYKMIQQMKENGKKIKTLLLIIEQSRILNEKA